MTYEFGDKYNSTVNSRPTIVLIHGYAGSALTYYPIFKYLVDKYHVIAIDLLGMGCSSRPEFLAKSTAEAGLFFVESLELWRRKIGLKDMNLVCHSLGSYIGVKYSHFYPQNVKSLTLLSPLGVERNETGYSQTVRRADTDAA
jgi:abhydrolase domain-containing protein 5